MPRQLEQGRVKVGVRVEGAQQIASLEQLAVPREACLHTGGAVLVDSRGSLADRKPFEDRAGLEDLDRLLVRDPLRTRAPRCSSRTTRPSCSSGSAPCAPHPRHTEGRADVRLDETGVEGDVAADDRRPKGLVARIRRHVSLILPERCEDRQQSCSLSARLRSTILGSPRPARQLADLAARRGDGQFYGNPILRSGSTALRPSGNRVLVQGAFDLHIRIAGRPTARRIDDVTLAHRFAELGLAGFALKSHYLHRREGARRLGRRARGAGSRRGGDEPGPRWDERARRRDRRARGRTRIRVDADGRSPAETAGRTQPKPGDKVTQARASYVASASRARARRRAGGGDRIRRRAPRGDSGRPARDRAPRADPRHGSPWPRRHVRGRRRRTGRGCLRDRRHALSSRARISRSTISASSPPAAAYRALSRRAVIRQDDVGARLRRHPCRRRRADGPPRATAGIRSTRPVEDGLALWADRLLGERFEEDEISEMIVGQSRRRGRLVSRRL